MLIITNVKDLKQTIIKIEIDYDHHNDRHEFAVFRRPGRSRNNPQLLISCYMTALN